MSFWFHTLNEMILLRKSKIKRISMPLLILLELNSNTKSWFSVHSLENLVSQNYHAPCHSLQILNSLCLRNIQKIFLTLGGWQNTHVMRVPQFGRKALNFVQKKGFPACWFIQLRTARLPERQVCQKESKQTEIHNVQTFPSRAAQFPCWAATAKALSCSLSLFY